MRSIIFIPLAILVSAIFLSAFSKANADISFIEGEVTHVYDGRTIAVDGQFQRISVVASQVGRQVANGPGIYGFEKLAIGQRISCRRLETDSYGNITAQCSKPLPQKAELSLGVE